MSNNKQSSVSSLITEIQRRVAIIQSEPQTMARELMIDNLSVDLEQYEAMHKEEIISDYLQGANDEAIERNARERFLIKKDAIRYYNETFGGNNEQQ